MGGAGGGKTERWQNFCPFTVDTLLIGSTLRGLVPRARPLRGNTDGRAFHSSPPTPEIFCRSSTGEPYVPFARGQLNNWRRPIFPTPPFLPSLNHRPDFGVKSTDWEEGRERGGGGGEGGKGSLVKNRETSSGVTSLLAARVNQSSRDGDIIFA